MALENDEQPAPLFDSLPYYDDDLETHPILREKVQHEVAVETQKIQQEALHPRVPPPKDLFVVSPSRIITVVPKSQYVFFRIILSSLQS
jgi:Breast carcinoma amplified sequence 2 (BCAS2)